MTNYKDIAPTHFALGPAWTEQYDSACGLRGMQHRAVKWTRDRARVSCGHCRRWLRKNPEVKVVS